MNEPEATKLPEKIGECQNFQPHLCQKYLLDNSRAYDFRIALVLNESCQMSSFLKLNKIKRFKEIQWHA